MTTSELIADCEDQVLPKRKFIISVYELHYSDYRVEADDAADAVEKINDGQGELIDNSIEYVETADEYGISHASLEEDQLDSFIERGLLSDDGFVHGIASIKEVTE
jgi:hypothetical protein